VASGRISGSMKTPTPESHQTIQIHVPIWKIRRDLVIGRGGESLRDRNSYFAQSSKILTRPPGQLIAATIGSALFKSAACR
jgi:hypothetical protein